MSEHGLALESIDGISDVRAAHNRLECEAVAGSYESLTNQPIVSRSISNSQIRHGTDLPGSQLLKGALLS